MTELFQDRPIEDQIDELTIQASKLENESWIDNISPETHSDNLKVHADAAQVVRKKIFTTCYLLEKVGRQFSNSSRLEFKLYGV